MKIVEIELQKAWLMALRSRDRTWIVMFCYKSISLKQRYEKGFKTKKEALEAVCLRV